MNISAISINIASSSAPQTTQGTQANPGTDNDGDSQGAHRAHRGHGHGGHMQQAVLQALKSLGLSTSQDGTQPNNDANSSSVDTPSNSGEVKKDMRHFMHALFQAVKSEGTAPAAGATDGSNGSPNSFAAGLSNLITQVSNGSAPAELQDAFNKLASDLQPAAAASNSTGAGNNGAAASAPPATLQALLTQLQQQLGYGNSSNASVGNLVSAQA